MKRVLGIIGVVLTVVTLAGCLVGPGYYGGGPNWDHGHRHHRDWDR